LIIENARAQLPTPDFSASTVAGCGPLSVAFKDLSTGSPFSWTWDFGNGQISSQQNPSMTFSNPGTYTITLIVKNSSGINSIQKTDYITVYPYPTANFSGNLPGGVGCVPTNASFTDLSTPGQGSITSWQWDFGDGTASPSQNPSHTFKNTGYYAVSLTVINSGGCTNKTIRNRFIRVVPGIQPDFTWSQSSASCSAPYDINFINQTSGPGNLTYNWDLGNGTPISTQLNPSTNYTANSSTVKLSVTSDLGCSATTTKTVNFQGNLPVITAPDTACVNTAVNFANGSPQALSSSWDFGDATTATGANPDKSYMVSGSYTVTLTNTYPSCTASSTKTIVIVNAPSATFTADKLTACASPLTVNFSSLLTGATGWQWDFGDGSSATTEKPQHVYNAIGKYTVTLTAATARGCSGTLSVPNYIRISPPSVTLNANSIHGCTNIPINPIPVIDAVDGVQTWQWTAPGATPSSSTAASPAFTYSFPGNYNLTLAIKTRGGCTFTGNFPGAVLIGDKVAPVFSADKQISCAQTPITFSSTSAPVDTWLWNFGDKGTSTSGPTTQRFYQDTGFFNVSLTVTNHGCSLTHVEQKYIYINAPIAGFKYKIVACNDPLTMQFIDTSTLDPTKPPPTYEWNFGDGSPPDFTANPIHHFSTPGIYSVNEIVNNGGCPSQVHTWIDLTPVQALFTAPDTVCKDAPFTLKSTSTPTTEVDSLSWMIDPVQPFTSFDTSTTYTTSIPDTGTYNISLKVIDRGGCPHVSTSKTLHVTGPAAKFTAGPGGCRNSPITFTDQSTSYPGYKLASWTFDFGDGNARTFTAGPFIHNYADTGSYLVKLTATDNWGCSDTFAILTPTRITAPVPGFYARDTLYCPAAPLLFTDSSRGSGLAYSWDFGDGSAASTDQNPTHPYTANGQYYSVKLRVTDAVGCSDSITKKDYIYIQKPIAAFTMEDSTSICIPLQTTFLPAGQYYDSLYWDFGDGSKSGLDTTTHFYNDYKTFTAILILQGAGGCRDSAKRDIHIYQPFNTTSLSFNPVSSCDSVAAKFIIATPPATKFTLFFGDGVIDSSGNLAPSHMYRTPNTYSPQIALQDSTGCVVSINRGTITVLGAVSFFNINQRQICDSGTVILSGAIISNDRPFSVVWDFGDGTSGPGRTNTLNQDTVHFYNAPRTALVAIKTTTNSGCQESYIDTIHIYQTPHPLISIDGTQCTGLIQFQGSLSTPVTDSLIWAWTFGDGQKSSAENPFLRFSAGSLTAHLQSSDTYGCKDTISSTVSIYALPVIKGPSEITTPVGFPVTLPFTYSSGTITWAWTPSDNLDCDDCPNPVVSLTFSTLYSVLVTDSNNCMIRDSVRVTTICNADNYFIPNTFSPNNDGVNDAFYPRGRSLYNIQSMRVFNRWGQIVFERKNFPANAAASGWDGTFNGHPAPADVYVYIIEVICDNAQVIPLKGDITLIR